jgi:phage tail-like protein
MTDSPAKPKLLDYLPAIYQEDLFLKQFLQPFEDILFGSVAEQGIEEKIAQIPNLFDPNQTPTEEFLSWLAEWAAFSVRADLEPVQQRAFIARVIPLYRGRGTMSNLMELLTIFVKAQPTIRDDLGEDKHHFFEVEINISGDLEEKLQSRQIEIARSIIDLEKPAHTYYKLTPKILSTIKIGAQSTIGINTVLGTPP